MPATTQEIIDAALALPAQDRLLVVDRLLETLPDEGDNAPVAVLEDPEFIAEIERRMGDTTGAIPWAQLRDEA